VEADKFTTWENKGKILFLRKESIPHLVSFNPSFAREVVGSSVRLSSTLLLRPFFFY